MEQLTVDPVAVACRLRVVGGFELSRAGEPVRLPVGAQRLLTFLAVQGRAQSRMHVAFALWAGASEGHAYGSLRSALFRLQAAGCRLVMVSKDELELAPEVAVDLRERLALVERLLAGETDGMDMELDPALLAGDVLPDCYEDWVLIERARYHELRLRALEALCERELRAGRLPQAVAAGQAAVRADPLRDSARRALIRANLAEGNNAQALAEYRNFAQQLYDQLGLQPSSEMIELVAGLTGR
jgi:SARP family transcriptional regulator, regulator of embCAB operon